MIRTLTLALAALLALPATAAEPTGPWLSGKGGTVVDIAPCGEALCGTIAWLKKPYSRKSGLLKRDDDNPDPALRHRPYCGLQVLRGLKPDGKGRWVGKGYDPKSGRSFTVDLEPAGDRMAMRGYVGVPLLGVKESWTRPPADLTLGCPTKERAQD